MIGYRPGEERGYTQVKFRGLAPAEMRLTHVSTIFPRERPFEVIPLCGKRGQGSAPL
jgi:hypothetical protein